MYILKGLISFTIKINNYLYFKKKKNKNIYISIILCISILMI